MHILFVDDLPSLKVEPTIWQLKYKGIDFTYDIVKSCSKASRYVRSNSNIDLIVVDLGLPIFDNEPVTNPAEGLILIKDIVRKFTSIPIIINSTTEIPNEEFELQFLKDKGVNIEHISELNAELLLAFLEKVNNKNS